jgi:16S rRNA processing protein RimM
MLLVVGVIVRAHGIRGEVLVDLRTDDPQQRFAPGSALITDPGGDAGGTLTVVAARPHQGRLIVSFEGVADRGEAEGLRGVGLCVDTTDLPVPSDPDEFNDHQLVGLRAETPEGEALGDVVRVEHAPASDLLVVRRPDGGTALVPFVKAIVPEADLAGGRVVLTPPGGLLDL